MDTDVVDQKRDMMKTLISIESPKIEEVHMEDEMDSELSVLLPPKKGGMTRNSKKVQWNDKNGNQLAQVLEFQTSDVSDSDEEDSDSCTCNIM